MLADLQNPFREQRKALASHLKSIAAPTYPILVTKRRLANEIGSDVRSRRMQEYKQVAWLRLGKQLVPLYELTAAYKEK